MANHHGAQESGEQREVFVKELLLPYDASYIRNTKQLRAPVEWKQDGYCYFIPDGYLPSYDAWVEIKAGRSKGTTEEKIWFTLEKIEGGVYGDKNLLIIFEGTVETNKNTRRFMRRVAEKKAAGDPRYTRIECCLFSQFTQATFDQLFSGKKITSHATLSLFD